MPQPTPYNRGFSFTDYQAASPSAPLPGYRVDAELDNIIETLTGVLGNLVLIQRDDGKLADGCVTVDAISADLLNAIAAKAPQGPKGDQGNKGDPGAAAANPNLVFSAHALAPGSAATCNVTGAYPNLNIDIGVPKGDAAAPGAATLADADYGDVTVSGGGSHLKVDSVLDGQVPSVAGHHHVAADVDDLAGLLAGKMNKAGDAGDFTTPGIGSTGAVRLRAQADDSNALLQITDNGVTAQWGFWAFTADGEATWNGAAGLSVNGNLVFHDGRKPTKADVGLGAVDNTADADKPISAAVANALAGKQAAGAYATTAQLAGKADAITAVKTFNVDQAVSDATHNGNYNIMNGATTRTITFGNLAAGHASIWVNRGTVNMTIACPGGYYKNGAAATVAANLVLAPGGKLTAFHEGAGVWAFDGTGF